MYLISKKKHKEFTIIKINLNIVRNDDKEYSYNKDDLYFKSNNTGYNDIIQINYIYNYCAFHLKPKIIKKKSNNNLKKIQVKTLTEILQIQYEKYIKEAVDIYIKRIIKDLNNKAFKYYIYIEYYNIALNLV